MVKVDFSSNVNPLGISKFVLEAIQKNAFSLSSKYPDTECRALKESLSDYLDNDLDGEWICVGNGATELIHSFAQTFVRNKVIIPFPTFCEYESASKRAGAGILFIPLNDLTLDPDAIIEKGKKSDVIFICNPNNPTGLMCSTKLIQKIVESVDSSTKVLVDESFIELSDYNPNIHTMINKIKEFGLESVDSSTKFLVDESFIELSDYNPNIHTMINKIKEFENLVILRSMTKSFGLAGLRIGYIICHPKIIKRLSNYQIPWNVNGLAQAAGIAALTDLNHLKESRVLIQKERKFMQEMIIRKMNAFIPYRSDVNYFLIYLENKNSTKVRDLILAEKGVLVRDCSTFVGMGVKYVRVAVKTHKENLVLLDALESIDN